jgi:serine protease Do
MKKALYLISLLFLVGLVTSNFNPIKPRDVDSKTKIETATSSLLSLEEAFISVAEKVKPAVVNLSTERSVSMKQFRFPDLPYEFRTPFDDLFNQFFNNNNDVPQRKFKQESLGSGVIIDKKGHILTNYHVIKDADKIKVTLLDGRKFDAKVIGSDSKTDLALIKIEATDLPFVELGDSDKVRVGQWAIAIGNPFGLNHTLTVGVISAKGRSINITEYEDFLQTDASINPGNSGGPLVNIRGEVIGINTAIVAGGDGIGFAVPINMTRKIIGDIIAHGKVTRAWLGIYIQDLTPELAETFNVKITDGVLVSEVLKDSPAEKAGVQRGDIIIAIDGKDVRKSKELQSEVINKAVQKKVTLVIFRDGEKKEISVTLEEMPEGKDKISLEGKDSFCGMQVQELTRDLATGLGLASDEKGVVITEVAPGSEAEEAGLQSGDLIKEIGKDRIDSIIEFRAAVSKIKKQKREKVLLLIKRDRHTYYVTIQTKK